jgi:asparagine synthase (glutamine-hydrolysing)
VPVLFSGDGADEFFAGYETYTASRIAAMLAPWIPSAIARRLGALLLAVARSSNAAVSKTEKAGRLLSGIATGQKQMHPQWRRHLFAEGTASLYGEALADVAEADPLDAYAAAMAGPKHLVDRCLLADQSYYLPGDLLVKSDTMSMAHSVELRVPFLDRRIMDFAGSLDWRLLTSILGNGKMPLRAALCEYGFGPSITARKKHGFNLPVGQMLREGLRALGERLLDADADALAPEFNPDGLRRIWREHQGMRANHSYVLWDVLCLAVMRENC